MEKVVIDQVNKKNILGPLDLWKMNITDIKEDEDIQYTALCIDSRS
jgi:hypothetical protein